MPSPSPTQRLSLLALLLASAVAVVVGWSTFWFLCDDAYIAFRYVSNAQRGWGYTWNPPPFLPVEGYTSFLWVFLLDMVWRITGVAPPASANALSLAAALATLPVLLRLGWCLPLPPAAQRYRLPILALAMVTTLTNRTWLAWTSSGLETALFTLLVLSWTTVGLTLPATRRNLAALALLASLIELCRPDGLLFWALTCAATLVWLYQRRDRSRTDVLVLAPLVIAVVHVAWRLVVYGAPLPNTYYAKQVAPWPEAGAVYLAAFVLEYALFVWIAVAALAALRSLGAGVRHLSQQRDRPELPVQLAVAAALVGQFAYYTLRVGGDHFEFRVYAHWVPLLALSLPWLWTAVRWRPQLAPIVQIVALVLGLVIPWTHWALTHTRDTREQTRMMRVDVAPHLPAVLSPWTEAWDTSQRWLIGRWIGMRHQEHAVYGVHQRERYPTREQGQERHKLEDYHAYVRGGAGYPGWVLPNVILLDQYGLNDFVVARNPKPPAERRRMAHDREPPPGYHSCFEPNLRLGTNRRIHVRKRLKPMTAERVAACERRFRAALP